jgi:hypothetical protein
MPNRKCWAATVSFDSAQTKTVKSVPMITRETIVAYCSLRYGQPVSFPDVRNKA